MARIYPSLGSLQNQTNSPNYGILTAPILHLPLQNNLNPAAGVGIVTFDRASQGSYIDRYGQVSFANIDEPRFEKNGLLIEGASTNLIRYSESFGETAYWTKVNCDLVPNTDATMAPTGLQEAYLLRDNTQYGLHSINQTVATTAGQYYTASIYVKRNTSDVVRLLISDTGFNSYYSVYVDLASGGLFNENITGSITNGSAQIVKLLGGWYRISLTALNPYTTLRLQARIVKAGADNAFYDEYAAEPADLNSVVIWGAQIEQQRFATSYIPTVTVPVTRTTDLMSINVLNLTMNYPNTENTFIMNFDLLGTLHDVNRQVFTVENFSYNAMQIDANGFHRAYYDGAGITDSTPLEAITQHRSVIRYNNGTYSLFRNGFKVAEKVKATPYNALPPTGMIYVGAANRFSENVLYGHITNFKLYDAALTDDEIRIV